MDNCENSNEKLMFFHVAKSRSETKLLLVQTKSIKTLLLGLHIATTYFPNYLSPKQRHTGPVFTISFLELNNFNPVNSASA